MNVNPGHCVACGQPLSGPTCNNPRCGMANARKRKGGR